MKKLFVILFVFISLLTPTRSQAIQGGSEAVGNPDVVALLSNEVATRPQCSAALITSMIVATAAHCVTSPNSEIGELWHPASDFWISAPGEDLNLVGSTRRYQVSQIFRTPGYVNVWRPNSGDIRTQKDDIAFLVLSSPVQNRIDIPLITRDDLVWIKSSGALITHIGYGMQNSGSPDGRPYLIELNANALGARRYSNNPALESNTITTNETGVKALCPGDSGSPWYTTIGGIKKFVAVTVGGSGCLGSGVNGALGTSVSEYGDIYASAKSAASSILSAIEARNIKLAQRVFLTCKALNQALPGGIAKSQATSKKYSLKSQAFVSPRGYSVNTKLDKDRDGIACEK